MADNEDRERTEADYTNVEIAAEAISNDMFATPVVGAGGARRLKVARQVIDALAAAGRLLPEGARRSVDLYGRGYVFTDPSTGQQHVLNPADVIVILPEGARAHGICGEHAPTLFGANLDLQVCELTAGHKGWHGRPNGPGEPWMNWTEDMIVSGSTDE
jgi:hypothetical protein